ncbi:hypothetical protein LTR97_003484 [Elasticomyces elasticus]|uniref:Uncharacterized protein n=1 Tax=Elasticomyces elasticus TaxID=574655 RepID=A0AAN8A2T9_9PEZI|nr:hypothetical protein LTR97_003484 [Elasticomyces elasticus]
MTSKPRRSQRLKAAKTSNLTCRILELPPELRLCIYGYVWEPVSHSVLVDYYNTWDVQAWHLNSHIWAPLSELHRTCRTIYQEATPYVYDSVIFIMRFRQTLPNGQSGRPLTSVADCAWLAHAQHIDLSFDIAIGKNPLQPQIDIEALRLLDLVLQALNTKQRRQGPELVGLDLTTHGKTAKEDLAIIFERLATEKLRGEPYVTLPFLECVMGVPEAPILRKEMELWFPGLAEGAHWLACGR